MSGDFINKCTKIEKEKERERDRENKNKQIKKEKKLTTVSFLVDIERGFLCETLGTNVALKRPENKEKKGNCGFLLTFSWIISIEIQLNNLSFVNWNVYLSPV